MVSALRYFSAIDGPEDFDFRSMDEFVDFCLSQHRDGPHNWNDFQTLQDLAHGFVPYSELLNMYKYVDHLDRWATEIGCSSLLLVDASEFSKPVELGLKVANFLGTSLSQDELNRLADLNLQSNPGPRTYKPRITEQEYDRLMEYYAPSITELRARFGAELLNPPDLAVLNGDKKGA